MWLVEVKSPGGEWVFDCVCDCSTYAYLRRATIPDQSSVRVRYVLPNSPVYA